MRTWINQPESELEIVRGTAMFAPAKGDSPAWPFLSRNILTYQSSLDVIDIRLRSEEIEKEKQGERQGEKKV